MLDDALKNECPLEVCEKLKNDLIEASNVT